MFPGCLGRAVWGFRRCHMSNFVQGTLFRPTVISRMCRRASMQWRPSMWCVSLMMISVWVYVARCSSVWMSVIWPGVTSLWITPAVTSVCVAVGMWSWPVKPVSLWVWQDVDLGWCLKLEWCFVLCRCTWWWYFVWTVCCNMTVFVTIKTFYMGTMACHVPWFLTLKTFVIFTQHDIYCGWGQ